MSDDLERVSLEEVLARFGATLMSEAEVAKRERALAAESRRDMLSLSGVSDVLAASGADAIIADRVNDTRAVYLVRKWLLSPTPVLALFGDRGLGKTVAAAWALARGPGRYVEAARLCQMRKERFGSPSEEYSRCTDTGLLVIDELGLEPNLDEARATLHDVVNRRQQRKRRTLLLGNMDRETFLSRYDARTIDRLREIAVIAAVEGESMRRGAL